MQALRQLGGGLIIAIVSIVLVIGGISLALAESAVTPAVQITAIVPASPTLQLIFPTLTAPATATQFPTLTEPPTASFTNAATATQPFVCTPPSGWYQIAVAAGDNIYTLAQRYKISEDALKNGNCLSSYDVQAGNLLYVPPIPATAPPIVCGPPFTWIRAYTVQSGDNLFRISQLYRTSVEQLQTANCMGKSNLIYSGQLLWVPNVPTSTPKPGSTLLFPSSTASLTASPTFTLSPWPTATTQFIPTASPSPNPTATPMPSATDTSAPAITSTPSLTPFPTP
ncbi:MAG: LysM peptidoglycan-binding domain-containing protein [Anaerolineales bacterium]|nr:LysM peptidoglycan-binding domain-containing protein [Anaerolineales bacterium]